MTVLVGFLVSSIILSSTQNAPSRSGWEYIGQIWERGRGADQRNFSGFHGRKQDCIDQINRVETQARETAGSTSLQYSFVCMNRTGSREQNVVGNRDIIPEGVTSTSALQDQPRSGWEYIGQIWERGRGADQRNFSGFHGRKQDCIDQIISVENQARQTAGSTSFQYSFVCMNRTGSREQNVVGNRDIIPGDIPLTGAAIIQAGLSAPLDMRAGWCLDRTIEFVDVRTAYNQLTATVNRDEFETSAQYQARLAPVVAARPRFVSIASREPVTSYNADRGGFELPGGLGHLVGDGPTRQFYTLMMNSGNDSKLLIPVPIDQARGMRGPVREFYVRTVIEVDRQNPTHFDVVSRPNGERTWVYSINVGRVVCIAGDYIDPEPIARRVR